MAVYSLIFSNEVPTRTRFQALTNLFCCIYIITITLMATHLGFFYIVPQCYDGDKWAIFRHRVSIWYIFTSVVGNYFTCILTETGAEVEESTSKIKEPEVRHNKGGSVVKRTVHKRNETTKDARKRKSETFCRFCNITVAERTHHCLLCRKCVIKRDHHCFFMGVCIGKANHLYFILFTLFMGMGTFYGLVLLAKYLYYLYGIRFYGPQTFFTLFFSTIFSLLKGQIPPFRYLGLFLLLYVSLVGTLASFGFFFWHVVIVARGQTTFEATRGITKYSKATYSANLQDVFNRHTIVSLLVPFWDLAMNKNNKR